MHKIISLRGLIAPSVIKMAFALAASIAATSAEGKDHENEPWRDKTRALVIDAYEYNQIDITEIASDKRIAGFISKASDGLPPPWRCNLRNAEENDSCKGKWRRYAMSRELHHTRKALALSLGLKWGAYHLARPGNPVEQADHFLQFVEPGPDDLMALDIEENNPDQFMSLADAEIFAKRIKARTGRFPVLYTNGATSKFIADNRGDYPVLSRLPLWYAQYKPDIRQHFPKGNWNTYTLWQFVSQANCNKRRCPYRIKGAGEDIDVNVANMTVEALKKAWPFGDLVPAAENGEHLSEIPMLVSRGDAAEGMDPLAFARVVTMPSLAFRLPWAAPSIIEGAGSVRPGGGHGFALTADALIELPERWVDRTVKTSALTQDDIAEYLGIQ